MTHSDWELQRERLSAYLDGELAASERAAVDTHLEGCGECQRELAALRQMRGLLRALPEPALPRAFTLPTSPASARGRVVPAWSRPAQALGGIAAMIGLGLLIATSLPHVGMGPSAAGASTAASEPLRPGSATSPASPNTSAVAGSASTAPSPTGVLQNKTLTPIATPAPAEGTASASGAQPPQSSQSSQPFPALPVTGGTLLVGGAAALAIGSLARRRARQAA